MVQKDCQVPHSLAYEMHFSPKKQLLEILVHIIHDKYSKKNSCQLQAKVEAKSACKGQAAAVGPSSSTCAIPTKTPQQPGSYPPTHAPAPPILSPSSCPP